MEIPLLFSARDALSVSVDVFGGTELVFVNLSEDAASFQMQVSFSIPHAAQNGVMLSVTGVGQHSAIEGTAEETACVAAIQVLQQEHGFTVLDYSIFRVWYCKERFTAFLEKLQNGRGTLADVLSTSAVVFDLIRSTFRFFGRKIGDLSAVGAEGTVRNSAGACADHLQILYAQAMNGHTTRAEEFEEINEPGDLSSLLTAAGFSVLGDEPDRTKLSGALEELLNRAATVLGYEPPEFEMRNQDIRFKCYVKFVSAGNGQGRTFTAFGKVAYDAVTARHTALYNSLLAFTVNYNVVIFDPNRNAYLFSKDRVDEVGADLGVLGRLGSSTCASVQRMMGSVNVMIAVYSSRFHGHPIGELLLARLQSLRSALEDCLGTITPLVRTMNEEAFVGMLPY
ncbi:unnamed protein product [Urochloa humidicola]